MMREQSPCGTMVQMASAVVDLIYRVDGLPARGSEVLASRSDIAAGGGFNAMLAGARAGLSVSYGGAHGTGPLADIVRSAMKDNGFPLLRPLTRGSDQGSCVVLVDEDGERSFISKEGVEGRFDHEDGEQIDPSRFDWILLSGYTLCYPQSRDGLHRWVKSLSASSGFVFDPAPIVAQIPKPILSDVLAKARWVSCNNREAETLTGLADPFAAANELLHTHCPAAEGAVVRLGADGCLVRQRHHEPHHLAGFEVGPIVDTNGAGDTHIGAFLAALSRGYDPRDAARYANAAAALSTLEHGPATAPTHKKTMAYLAEISPNQQRFESEGAHPGAARSKTHRFVAERL